ncbi:hypothetical protein ACFC96_10375 [Streptomyces sp. NPDC055955]|uniref:hypothetical protein n=1 Tax=Streptomyces sp. NPDC055955 TaxID=3345665 RepID=UPI0035D91485
MDRVGLAYTGEWTFPSSAATQGAQRLLVPVLDVPSDLRNARPAGEATTIGLRAVVDGTNGAVRLDDVRLEYAYGAATTTDAITDWHTASVTRSHDAWRATLPTTAPSGTFVHLRVTMADNPGAKASQTMVRAYEVL